jgi:hypothetical protein
MIRLLLVCLSAIVWCLVSCTDKDKIPAGVLPKERMEKVLWDMILAERYRDTFVRDSAKDLKVETFKLYAQVFQIHQVSKDEFVKSYKFYMSRPDIAREMFDSLATRASRRREDLYKPKPLDTASVQQKVDSLNNADTSKAVEKTPPVIQPAASQSATKQPVLKPDTQRATGLPQPFIPKQLPPNFRKGGKRLPFNRHLKVDTATQLRLRKQ